VAWQQNFLTDGLGSTVALADATGTVATEYSYEPFGGTTVGGVATTNSLQYTGRENDGTGLYYYRARYYSPVFQRFLTEDPLGFNAGVNFYSYVLNDPINSIDPQGLKIIYRKGVIPPNSAVRKILECIDKCNGDKDVEVTSGKRTPEVNRRAGGRPRSRHCSAPL
jgi:RHS repeat-associated protein